MQLKNLFEKKFFGFDLYVICFFFVVFTIPWSNNLNSQAIILFCVVTTLTPSISDKRTRLQADSLWIYFVAFFILIACSLIWDDQPIESLRPLEKYAGFLFLPFFIAAMPRLTSRSLKASLVVFVISTVIIVLLCYVKSANEYAKTHDYRVFHYQYLSQQMNLNAVYLALYCCFSILILLYYFFAASERITLSSRVIALLLCLFLTGSIILLSAKMIIVVLAVEIIAMLLYIGSRKGQLLKSAMLILVICTAGAVAISQIHYIKWRMGVTELKKYEGAQDNQNGLAVRQIIWESVVELIREKPLLGYGIQSASEKLISKYREKNFELGIAEEYNAHNTYLQVGLHCGIAGISALLLLLGAVIKRAIVQRNFLLLVTLLMIIPQSITESMLEVQKGIIFIVLFICLLAHHGDTNKILSYPSRR